MLTFLKKIIAKLRWNKEEITFTYLPPGIYPSWLDATFPPTVYRFQTIPLLPVNIFVSVRVVKYSMLREFYRLASVKFYSVELLDKKVRFEPVIKATTGMEILERKDLLRILNSSLRELAMLDFQAYALGKLEEVKSEQPTVSMEMSLPSPSFTHNLN